jgi:hypothetical protein
LAPSGVNTHCPRRDCANAVSPFVSMQAPTKKRTAPASRISRGQKPLSAPHPREPLRTGSVRRFRMAIVANQPSSVDTSEDSGWVGEREDFAPLSRLPAPVMLSMNATGMKNSPSSRQAGPNTKSFMPGSVKKGNHNGAKRELLKQFRYQVFKKCFHVKCLTIFVPGDFKPSSPRRMFCSLQCFEDHWREKLSRYLERTVYTKCSPRI